MLRLVAIFNFISAGIDLLYALAMIGVAIFIPVMIAQENARGVPAGSSPPPALFAVIYGACAVLSAAVGTVKLIGARKILARGCNAWGWGLAMGICGCPQLWCGLFFVLPLAAGIFTIVIMCRQDVRTYLSNPAPAPPAF